MKTIVFRKATTGYGRFFAYGNGTLKWEFLEVDLQPCAASGDAPVQERCAVFQVNNAPPDYIRPTTIIDQEWYHVSFTICSDVGSS